ncbi:GNAT family N-acetyltransferase [Thalassobacillus devorans]|uniref:GNAT family N-acetyltransferase n=1 Tax=Thalassobacillus devorans TaxID=279813 RepID=UPI0004B496A2|nr:GNAT family N-acetyltransferase [Thalassobacillus devorans]
MITVKEITAEDTYKLRQKEQRNSQNIEDLPYQGDQHETTFHLGAFENGKLAGVASFYMETTDAIPSHKQIRIKGLAVEDPDQELRIGTTLLHKANRILYHGNVEFLWCMAPAKAQAYYERMGFSSAGESCANDLNGTLFVLYKAIEKP